MYDRPTRRMCAAAPQCFKFPTAHDPRAGPASPGRRPGPNGPPIPAPGPRIPCLSAYLFAPALTCVSFFHPADPAAAFAPPPRQAPRSPRPPPAGPYPLRPSSGPSPGPSPVAHPTPPPLRPSSAPHAHQAPHPDPGLPLLAAAVASVAGPPHQPPPSLRRVPGCLRRHKKLKMKQWLRNQDARVPY